MIDAIFALMLPFLSLMAFSLLLPHIIDFVVVTNNTFGRGIGDDSDV